MTDFDESETGPAAIPIEVELDELCDAPAANLVLAR
jgi:hypothetical protein